MKIRRWKVMLLRVVFCVTACWGLAFWPGAMTPAFAEAGSGAGGISGGFFADYTGPQEMPGNRDAMPEKARPGDSGLCDQAVANASAGHHLPAGLLGAIATVESGRLDARTGAAKPWPWTVDANGTGYVYESVQSAIQAAQAFEAAGITSLDIGCLQVNLAQHPDAFQTLAQAFDPAANAEYAATFLTSLEQKFDNWPQAVAAYHSQTPALGAPYAAKVYAAWQGAPGAAPMALALADHGGVPAAMTGVLPQGFDMSSMAPPASMLMRSGRALNNRGLASYRAAPVAIAARLAPQG